MRQYSVGNSGWCCIPLYSTFRNVRSSSLFDTFAATLRYTVKGAGEFAFVSGDEPGTNAPVHTPHWQRWEHYTMTPNILPDKQCNAVPYTTLCAYLALPAILRTLYRCRLRTRTASVEFPSHVQRPSHVR